MLRLLRGTAALAAAALLAAGCSGGGARPPPSTSGGTTGGSPGSASGASSTGGSSGGGLPQPRLPSVPTVAPMGGSGSSGSTSSGSTYSGSTSSGTTSSSSTSTTGSSGSTGTSGTTGSSTTSSGTTGGSASAAGQHVFVIALENAAASDIYGNSGATYLNNVVIPNYAHATNFGDVLPLAIESGPHYVWMAAGTNTFDDHAFVTDDDPSASQSTASAAHLFQQLDGAGKTWRIYMEGLDANSGACPIYSNGVFAAWHNPAIWFHDVSGNPPAADNAYCAAHHRAFSLFSPDLASGDVADFTFITPDLCHNLHGAPSCPDQDFVHANDQWLAANVPPILDYVNAHGGVLMIVFDETSATNQWGDPLQPFFVLGPKVKPGFANARSQNLSDYLRGVEDLLGVPALPTVQGATGLGDYFQPGGYP